MENNLCTNKCVVCTRSWPLVSDSGLCVPDLVEKLMATSLSSCHVRFLYDFVHEIVYLYHYPIYIPLMTKY